jgi:hypothetical protein
MKNLKLIFAGLCWAYLTVGVSACEMNMQEREELRALCMPITAGCPNPELPITQKDLEIRLLPPFIEKVALVPRDERRNLVSLVTPWFDTDKLTSNEIPQRMRLLQFTEKLAHAPFEERDDIMRAVNRIVDLITPALQARQHSRVFETNFIIPNSTCIARAGCLMFLLSIDAPYLKKILDLALPEIESAPQNEAHLVFCTAITNAKKNLGLPE